MNRTHRHSKYLLNMSFFPSQQSISPLPTFWKNSIRYVFLLNLFSSFYFYYHVFGCYFLLKLLSFFLPSQSLPPSLFLCESFHFTLFFLMPLPILPFFINPPSLYFFYSFLNISSYTLSFSFLFFFSTFPLLFLFCQSLYLWFSFAFFFFCFLNSTFILFTTLHQIQLLCLLHRWHFSFFLFLSF